MTVSPQRLVELSRQAGCCSNTFLLPDRDLGVRYALEVALTLSLGDPSERCSEALVLDDLSLRDPRFLLDVGTE